MMKAELSAAVLTQVKAVVKLVHEIFKTDLQAVYLYGSAVMQGLRSYSDIDLLLVTKRKLTGFDRTCLTQQLLQISGSVGDNSKRPLEVTVVCSSDLTQLLMPIRFEYMYGEWLREEMESGEMPQALCDADNAVLLWQARRHSIALYGEPAAGVLPEVPFAQIQKAIFESLPTLLGGLNGDERNVLLTLTRMWYTLELKDICAKDAAAEWAKAKLPVHQAAMLELARQDYLNGTNALNSIPLADINGLAELLAVKIKQFEVEI